MIGADGLGNENANRKVAQTNGIMVIDAEIRYNGTAGTVNDGRNIILWVSGIIASHDCGVYGQK